MQSAIAPNAVSFVLAALLAASVLARRVKSPLHWTLLAMLGGIVLWTGGAVWRHSATHRDELLAAFRVMFLGVAFVPPLWLLLAARFARLRQVEGRPGVSASVLAPAVFFYLAFLTNERHGAFARIEMDAFSYGPLFWVLAVWAWGCVAGGIALFLRRARWMAAHQERPRAVLLAGCALVPAALNGTYLLELLPWSFDPTPVALGFSAALLFPVIFRFRLLGGLPLLRRDVIEYLRDGVVIADARGTILDVNPAAVRLLGRPADALRGQPLRETLVAFAVPEDRWAAELALHHPDDDPDAPRAVPEVATLAGRRIRISAPVVAGGDGTPAGQFVVLHDRTEERKRERALRQAQKLESVGFLAAGVAHEVNNPLAFVRANLGQLAASIDLVKELARDAPRQRREELLEWPQIVEETREGVDRIAQIVARMRRLSRDGEEERDEVDANAAVRESAKLAQLARGFTSVALAMDLDPSLPPVRGSRDGLVQVFLNLLLNAKQALQEGGGGSIRVCSRAQGGSVLVEIADDGPGIPEELQERIFDPFFTTKGPDEGTGLGLPIAFDIVREHRGALEVESRPGEGSCFRVRLPALGASRADARKGDAER